MSPVVVIIGAWLTIPIVAFVAAMGFLAWRDKRRFPAEPPTDPVTRAAARLVAETEDFLAGVR